MKGQTRNRLLQALLLALMVWAVYANSLHNPFHFDDFHVIPDNPAVRRISDIPSFFVDPTTFSILPGNRDYRPIFLISMALAWQMGDGSTLPFHLVSVTIHMSIVLLLWLLFRRTLSGERSFPSTFSETQRETAAFIGAAIFALHPLTTEPVNYISSQSVLLAAFFYLFSFYLFLTIYASKNSQTTARQWSRRGGSYLAYFFALLSKPIAITLPGTLLLWECVLRQSPEEPETASQVDQLWKRLRKHIPYWGVTLLYLVIRQAVLPRTFGGTARPILTHYLTQTKAMVMYYLKFAVFPFGLNVDPEFPLSTSIWESDVLFSLLILAVIVALLVRFRKQRVVVFWAFWFPICLLVTTYLTVLGQVVNEHRVYLSLAGVTGLAGFLLVRGSAIFPVNISDLSIGPKVGRIFSGVVMAVILAALAFGTIKRNQVWTSDFALWQNAALNDGTWRAHMNYGLALENAGRSDEALQQFEQAVDLFPGAYSHINLGLAYVRRDSMRAGIWHLREAVRLWPDLPEAHLFLGYGLEQTQQVNEAESELLTAIRYRPNYLKGYRLLGEFYERQGQPKKARTAYEKLLQLDRSQSWAQIRIDHLARIITEDSDVQFDAALMQIAGGNYSEAVAILSEAHPRHTKRPELLFNLAFSHQMLGNRNEAIRYYEELLQVDPNHVKGNFNLAYAYMQREGREELERSAALFKNVLKQSPDYSEALFRLATVHWKLGDEREAKRYDRLYLDQGQHEALQRQSRSRLASSR